MPCESTSDIDGARIWPVDPTMSPWKGIQEPMSYWCLVSARVPSRGYSVTVTAFVVFASTENLGSLRVSTTRGLRAVVVVCLGSMGPSHWPFAYIWARNLET